MLHDALEKAMSEPHEHEDFFASQNDATHRMTKEVSDSYDAMAWSLIHELAGVLGVKV